MLRFMAAKCSNRALDPRGENKCLPKYYVLGPPYSVLHIVLKEAANLSEEHRGPALQIPIVSTQMHQDGKMGKYYDGRFMVGRAHIQEGAVNVACPPPYRPDLCRITWIAHKMGNADKE